jgi:hypothetical protein
VWPSLAAFDFRKANMFLATSRMTPGENLQSLPSFGSSSVLISSYCEKVGVEILKLGFVTYYSEAAPRQSAKRQKVGALFDIIVLMSVLVPQGPVL